MKKAVSLLLALLLCVGIAAPVLAAETASGQCGDNVRWALENGTLTISGTGPMADYAAMDPENPFTKNQAAIQTVIIKEGVTSIGAQSFAFCFSLTDVAIPEGITSIGECAFLSCAALAAVTIPDSVTTIGDSAFVDCPSLATVTIGKGVTRIENSAFWECTSLTDVYYGGSADQWEQIQIGTGNDDLRKAKLHCSDDTPAAPSAISVTVNGKAVVWTDVEPFIDANDRTMVPLRAVADAMGLEVSWDGDARVAGFSKGDKAIYFPIDSSTAQTSAGGSVKMDTAAVIVNDRTYAPIRYLAEYFGYEVGWDGATKTVSLG